MNDFEFYQKKVSLLIRLLASVKQEHCFALKGGTAINLFFWDMPRLSVDIDLTYLISEPREAALDGIHDAMERIEQDIRKRNPGIQTAAKRDMTTVDSSIDPRKNGAGSKAA